MASPSDAAGRSQLLASHTLVALVRSVPFPTRRMMAPVARKGAAGQLGLLSWTARTCGEAKPLFVRPWFISRDLEWFCPNTPPMVFNFGAIRHLTPRIPTLEFQMFFLIFHCVPL